MTVTETAEFKRQVSIRRQHVVRTLVKGGFWFVCAWVLAIFVDWLVVSNGGGHWIELLNGATWPSHFTPIATPPPTLPVSSAPVSIGNNTQNLGFFIVLGLRTVLNMGVILSGVALLFVFFSSIGKEWLMTKMASMLSSRDYALAAYVLIELSKEKAKLPPEIQDLFMTKASEFSTSEAGQVFLKAFYSDAQSMAQELARARNP